MSSEPKWARDAVVKQQERREAHARGIRIDHLEMHVSLETMILKVGMATVIGAVARIANDNSWERTFKHLDRAFRSATIEGGKL